MTSKQEITFNRSLTMFTGNDLTALAAYAAQLGSDHPNVDNGHLAEWALAHFLRTRWNAKADTGHKHQ